MSEVRKTDLLQERPKTVCINCRFVDPALVADEPHVSPARALCYTDVAQVREGWDPVTGKIRFRRLRCADVNKGKCVDFQSREGADEDL